MSDYIPGSWFAAIAPQGAVVLPAAAGPERARNAWVALQAGGGLASVLETLTGAFGTSLAAIPPFAVVTREGDEIRIAVRGALSVGAAGVTVTGAGVTTWNEQVVAGTGAVTIDTGDAAAPGAAPLPLVGGIVMVSRVVVAADLGVQAVVAGVVDDVVEDASVDLPEVEAQPEAEVEREPEPEPEAELEAEVEPEPEPEAEVEPEPEAEPEPEVEPKRQAEPEPEVEPEPEPEAEPAVAVEVEAEAEAEPEPEIAVEDLGPDDDQWGATVVKGATDPAFRRSPAPASQLSHLAVFPPPTGVPVATAPGLISAVPGAVGTRPGDHDGMTISVAQSRALRAAAQADAAGAPAAEPVAVPEPTPVAVPEVAPASTARIVLSTGRELLLDRTVVIGRRPSSTRTTGGMLPHLVAVESPEQDISRSHVEIRPEGDAVVVTDLKTTNGTLLRRTGHEPVQLHPGEPTVVVSGDVLEIGDDVSVTFVGIA